MAAAKKIEIVNEAGDEAVRVESGVVRTTPGAAQDPTARAHKVVIVDPVTGSIADVVGGALVVS